MGADLGRRAPNPYGHSAGEGAAALELARQRSEMAAGGRELLSEGEAGKLARVSFETIRLAWRAGDLKGERTASGSLALEPEEVLRWARSKRYIV